MPTIYNTVVCASAGMTDVRYGIIPFNIINIDTHGGFVYNQYNIPLPGAYAINLTGIKSGTVTISKNYSYAIAITNSSVSLIQQFFAGDIIQLAATNADVSDTMFSIFKISGDAYLIPDPEPVKTVKNFLFDIKD